MFKRLIGILILGTGLPACAVYYVGKTAIGVTTTAAKVAVGTTAVAGKIAVGTTDAIFSPSETEILAESAILTE